MHTNDITFQSIDRGEWLTEICKSVSLAVKENDIVRISIDNTINKDELEPIHCVTLANLIEYFYQKKCAFELNGSQEMIEHLNSLHFNEYWTNHINHVDSEEKRYFNLWRIAEGQCDLFSKQIEKYLNDSQFKGRDLSQISCNLQEAFYNVFDHAKAGGNAFSFIKYDGEKLLSVAVSDFGIGIPESLRTINPDYSDQEALEESVKEMVTAGTTDHNRGCGLFNIITSSKRFRLFSKSALLYFDGFSTRTYHSVFSFPGTLLYFELDLTETEECEVIDFDL